MFDCVKDWSHLCSRKWHTANGKTYVLQSYFFVDKKEIGLRVNATEILVPDLKVNR